MLLYNERTIEKENVYKTACRGEGKEILLRACMRACVRACEGEKCREEGAKSRFRDFFLPLREGALNCEFK